MGNHADFYSSPHGFPKAIWQEHDPAPEQFRPAYIRTPEFPEKGYYCEEMRGGFYYVVCPTGYDAAFLVTRDGVIAIDAPPGLGENMLAAIESVTDKAGGQGHVQPLALHLINRNEAPWR